MYNKISSIILNSAKATSLSDVFVAQPDTLKESQAGKIFVLAEIGGKKIEGRKFFNFLIRALSDNYYNDEKILFKDKIPGLKIENIFEAAVTKTNRDLADFLVNEKIQLNPAATNLTIGVIYENKIHFANFGRNRSLLVFRRGDDYEIINVEANAAEALAEISEAEATPSRAPKLFSSVISGEIPLASYFVLGNEALPEYLSGQEMIGIITKLPPLAAAEQIKNVLTKVNTYIPFLGIIIKNTTGLATAESKEDLEEFSAHSSISSLNYTEQKTERMLAPAGLINLSGMLKKLKNTFKNWRFRPARPRQKYIRTEEERVVQPPLDLGTVRSLNMAGSGSFLKPDKIFFKKRTGAIGSWFKNLKFVLAGLFGGRFWSGLGGHFRFWLMSLNKKNRWLFVGLSLAVIVLIVSVLATSRHHQRATAEKNFNNLVTAVTDKETEINNHLLYKDEAGATGILTEAQSLLASLPQENDNQKATYQELSAKLASVAEKLQKIIRITSADKINDLIGLDVNNLTFAAGKIYAAGKTTVYALTPKSASSSRIEIKGANNLSNPHYYSNNIYYWDTGNIVKLDFKNKTGSLISTADLELASSLTSFKIYANPPKLYSIARDKNQIYVYVKNAKGFSAKADWLKENADLSQAVDLGIDSDIYVLKADGAVLRFSLGKAVKYDAAALSPVMTSANKLIVGTKYLYIFEAASKRLAVLSKETGLLANQYVIESLGQAKDVTIDEVGKAAYFL
ncbi:MAG: hypothetical protein NTY31_03475, partial [Candidatus Falkowbacteria bacterium]|nr:hypothetical protein [Candidatus Falkowbacteria bacterium]